MMDIVNVSDIKTGFFCSNKCKLFQKFSLSSLHKITMVLTRQRIEFCSKLRNKEVKVTKKKVSKNH